MNTTSSPRRTGRLAVLLAGLTLVAAACGDDGDGGTGAAAAETVASTAAPSEDASDAPATLPDKITIGYQQIPNGDLIVKHEGLLEQAFGGDVTIEWRLFDSGGSVNEAILAGGIDIGLVGSSPASRGLSSGIEYSIPWIFDVIGKAEALVVHPDSGIESVADLAGATIATPFASTAHYSLLAALADAGVAETDVHIIDSEPDAIYAAWQQGDIDGAYVWNPNLAKLVDEGGTVLVTSEDLAKKGKTTYDLAVVTNEFAAAYPNAVQIWVEQQNAAVQKITSDPDAAAAAIAAELNITPEEARQQMDDLVFLDAAEQAAAANLGGGLAANLYAAAQFNRDLGQIESVQPESVYQQAVLTEFAAAAAG